MLESKYVGPTLLPRLINLQLGFNTWPSRSQDFGNCLLNVSGFKQKHSPDEEILKNKDLPFTLGAFLVCQHNLSSVWNPPGNPSKGLKLAGGERQHNRGNGGNGKV